MRSDNANLASRSGNLVESHTSFQPRVFFFYFFVAALLLTLAGGIAYQQIAKTLDHNEAEMVQSQRRIVVPGPRGNIYDRDGNLVVGNHPRFAAVIYLDELRPEFRDEYKRILKNYVSAASRDKNNVHKDEIPAPWAIAKIARSSVVQHYLDQICHIIGREVPLSSNKLEIHFSERLLIPYPLINDLSAEEYARLIEKMPVKSPVQVYTNSVRYYPFGQSARHAIGLVSRSVESDADENASNKLNIRTFPIPGFIGRDGLEFTFDSILQGEPGGTLFRVDPSGYRINPPLEKKLPVQGKNISCSLDMDIQKAAEESMGDYTGAAVMLDVNTGEVLTMASKPDFKDGGFLNRALSGVYQPGSTFKLLTSIAAFKEGKMNPDSVFNVTGTYIVGGHVFHDHHGCITGEIDFRTALEHSVNTYFQFFGHMTGVEAIDREAKRFGLDQKTGLELPHETRRMLIGSPEWKLRVKKEHWQPGDTVNLAIGQGFISVTPLQMACFAASLARGETRTKPTLLHDPNHPRQHSEAIGITKEQYAAIVEGMERVFGKNGTAKYSGISGFRMAGKTGTAQYRTPQGTLEFAWCIGFAPIENPQIAWCVLIEGDKPDESNAGGATSGPIAQAMVMKWLEKQADKDASTRIRVQAPKIDMQGGEEQVN